MFEKREILIASGNPYKQKKLVELVAPFFVPRIAEKLPSFQERGESFLSIAENKAIDYSKHFHSLVVSTDGGASIPALSPEEWNPLTTRRFLNADDDRERIHKVLDLMREEKNRTVEWREAIAVADNGMLVFSHEARAIDGVISKSFRPELFQEGIWLCSITDFPQFGGRNYFELTDEERKQTENSWELLREAFRKSFSKVKPGNYTANINRPLSKLPHLCYPAIINKIADLCMQKYQNSRRGNFVARPV